MRRQLLRQDQLRLSGLLRRQQLLRQRQLRPGILGRLFQLLGQRQIRLCILFCRWPSGPLRLRIPGDLFRLLRRQLLRFDILERFLRLGILLQLQFLLGRLRLCRRLHNQRIVDAIALEVADQGLSHILRRLPPILHLR